MTSSLVPIDATDLQAQAPSVLLALDMVGVEGLVRGALVEPGGPATLRLDVATDLAADARGAHMSRFHEALDEVLVEGRRLRLDQAALDIASAAARLQQAPRARAQVSCVIVDESSTPRSRRVSRDPMELQAGARVDLEQGRADVWIRVAVTGMTACPCAQVLVRRRARERLLEELGLEGALADRVLEVVPGATHNQRGTATVTLERRDLPLTGDPLAVVPGGTAAELARLARASMSAPVHELLKRDDERAVVEAAHGTPRFVEDCVRELLRACLDGELGLRAGDVLRATQRNHESIHAHDVVATRSGTVATLHRELATPTTPPRA